MAAFRVLSSLQPAECRPTTAQGTGPCSLHVPMLRGITKCPRSQAPTGRLPQIQWDIPPPQREMLSAGQ